MPGKHTKQYEMQDRSHVFRGGGDRGCLETLSVRLIACLLDCPVAAEKTEREPPVHRKFIVALWKGETPDRA